MKIKPVFLALLAYVSFSACKSSEQLSDDLIVIDVSQDWAEKEVSLEEIADIEYLQLELDNDYLFSEMPQVITQDKIIIKQLRSGDIFIFSRDGKPVNKFNKRGNGPGEYLNILRLMYDEATDEIFIKTDNKKIMVYAVTGDFKREILLEKRLHFTESFFFDESTNFDSESFLFYDKTNRFSLVLKEDGSITDSIGVPVGKDVVLEVRTGNMIYVVPPNRYVRYKDGFLLTDYTVDTVYFLSRKKELSPVLVRKPEIQTMDPTVYLNSFIEAGGYDFMSAVTVKNENGKLPRTYLMYDKKTGNVYRQNIIFNDYKGKQVYLSPEIIASTQDSRLGLIVLDIEELREANGDNKLSGKLKQLVDSSDEEGNNIFMLLHFK